MLQLRQRLEQLEPTPFDHLTVAARSTIGGQSGHGLFVARLVHEEGETGPQRAARRVLPAGTIIGEYTVGTRAIDEDEVEALRRDGRCTHVAFVRGRGYFDGSEARVGFIQRAPTLADVNVVMRESGRLVLTREVHENQELFMRYGPGYVILPEDYDDADRQAERQLVRTEAARRRMDAQLEREQAEIGQAWAAGQGIFRSEMGAQRREERQLERARRMEEPRIWETGKRDRALSARRSRSSSPTVCL
jgi:hypothetical protein